MPQKNLLGVRILGLFFISLALIGCRDEGSGHRIAEVQNSPIPLATKTESPQETPPPPSRPKLHLQRKGDTVELNLPWKTADVYRGYVPYDKIPRASRKKLVADAFLAVDRKIPSDIVLYYLAIGPGGQELKAQICIPNEPLPHLVSPSLEVDKSNFTLEVLDQGTVRKRYPIALGQNPINRKFCQDMASTPEGWYEIYNLQPNATYHKALDVDYPRPIDHVRHQLAIENGTVEAGRPIGGEIQIHGWGIGVNWTAGCMALRDKDMDEIFQNRAIRAGMPVFIAGSQLRPSDKEWLVAPTATSVRTVQKRLKAAGFYQGVIDGQFGNGTALALGRYQKAKDLPDSCQLDGKTRRHFGLH